MKLFPKTFLQLFFLLAGMILVVFLLIYSFLPGFYRQYKRQELASNTKQLAAQLQLLPSTQIADRLFAYALSHGYGYTAVDEHGEILCSAGVGISFEMVGDPQALGQDHVEFGIDLERSEQTFYTTDGKTICLSLSVSLQPIEDAVSVLLLVLPLVLVLCLLLSAAAAGLYSRSLTRPIQTMTQATLQMQTLSPHACCQEGRTDEIGLLSRNINEMYQKLRTVITDLERELAHAGRAEREKLDFLLLASHELKTPVTAVRGMIEGMRYQVGIYKDRDKYLEECQKTLETLTERICHILETTQIDAFAAAQKQELTDIGQLITETAEPFLLIAQNKNITLSILQQAPFSAQIPAELIKKALSNILSNAVRYTQEGCAVRIVIKQPSLVIENECDPLSEEELSQIKEPFYHPSASRTDPDSTGLGLYLTDRILSACRLSYTFRPCETGMRFTLHFP